MHGPTQQLRERYGADVRRVGLRSTYEVKIRGAALPSDAELIAMCGGLSGIVRSAGTAPGGAHVYLVTVTR